MRYLVLATDYDGTLAKDGHVDEPTLAALERLRDSGRRLILVTGRELDELLGIFPQMPQTTASSTRTQHAPRASPLLGVVTCMS